MDDDTIIEIEGRQYVSPTKSRDEQLAFIDTLRDVTAENTAQINQNTYNLGSPVTSNVGGLGGSEALWQAQYQTPQVDATIADLRTVAQQQALNQELSNLQDVYQNRYKQARRSYSRRNKASSSSTATPLGNTSQTADDPEINYESTSGVGVGTITARPGEKAITSPWTGDDGNPINYIYNENNELVRLDGVVDRGSATYNALKKRFPNLVD